MTKSMSLQKTLAPWTGCVHMLVVILLAAYTTVGRADPPSASLVDIATDATDPQNLADTEPSIAVSLTGDIAVVSFSEPWDKDDAKVMAPVWKSADGGLTW